MSLKAVHIVLILCSVILCFFFGVWALRGFFYGSGSRLLLALGALSTAGGVFLIFYLYWFWDKMREKNL